MTGIEVGMNKKGDMAILKVYTKEGGEFTMNGLNEYESVMKVHVNDTSKIRPGEITRDDLEQIISPDYESISKLLKILRE